MDSKAETQRAEHVRSNAGLLHLCSDKKKARDRQKVEDQGMTRGLQHPQVDGWPTLTLMVHEECTANSQCCIYQHMVRTGLKNKKTVIILHISIFTLKN